MTGRNHISEELNELNSSLPAIHEPVFNLPTDYFENFAATVLARIKADTVKDELSEISPLLAGLSKKNPFTLPENYFTSLQTDFVSAEEELPAILKTIDRKMPFEVPAGYFQSLPGQILSKQAPAKVVPMFRTWKRMAVAAVVATVMATSGLFYFGNKANSPAVDSPGWVNAKLDNVSDNGLEEFITATAPAEDELASSTVKPQEVRAMLSDVSDNEMDAFLEDLPTDDEELSVIN